MNELQVMPAESATVSIMPGTINAEALIARAIDAKVPVEVLERLLTIRRELKAEASKEAFDRSLADFQRDCPTIQKTKKVMNKDGRSVRYAYAPLESIVEQVRELLQHHGFSYTMDAQAETGFVTAVCTITHALGHSNTSQLRVPIEVDAYMNEAQKVASALTFAKRYAFCGAFGILTGDEDDDSISSGRVNASQTSRTPGPAPAPPRPAPTPPAKPSAANRATVKPLPLQQLNEKFLENCKAKFLQLSNQTMDSLGIIWQYAVKQGWILENEKLDAVTPSKLFPGLNTEDSLEVNRAKVGEMNARNWEGIKSLFEQEPDGEMQAKFAAVYAAEILKAQAQAGAEAPLKEPEPENVQVPRELAPEAPEDEWWREVTIHFGKSKGEKLGEMDKKRLYGWVKNWTPEPYNGKISDADKRLREALSAAGEHYGFH